MDLRTMSFEDGINLGSCPLAGSGVSVGETSGSVTRGQQ
jgi:hypothetical protein